MHIFVSGVVSRSSEETEGSPNSISDEDECFSRSALGKNKSLKAK